MIDINGTAITELRAIDARITDALETLARAMRAQQELRSQLEAAGVITCLPPTTDND